MTTANFQIGQKINHVKCDDLMTIVSMKGNMVTLTGSTYGSFEIRRTKSSLLKYILNGELECITTN